MAQISANSRFQRTPLIPEKDERFTEWKPIRFGEVPETIYIVAEGDVNRPDLISYRNYGVCDLWWAIMFYNGVVDPFSLEIGDRLRIPSRPDLELVLAVARTDRLRLRNAQQDISKPNLPSSRTTETPTLRRILTPAELTALNNGSAPVLTDRVVFIYGFEVPENLIGNVHFQLQIAADDTFATLVLNRFTATSQFNWYYYNPAAQNAAGGFVAFPSTGIDGVIYEGQQVYLNIFSSDGLAPGTEYFARYRTWVDNVESDWYVSPPVMF